jgi:hypothetical protein
VFKNQNGRLNAPEGILMPENEKLLSQVYSIKVSDTDFRFVGSVSFDKDSEEFGVLSVRVSESALRKIVRQDQNFEIAASEIRALLAGIKTSENESPELRAKASAILGSK